MATHSSVLAWRIPGTGDSFCWVPDSALRSRWQSQPRQEAQPGVWGGRVKGHVEAEDKPLVEAGTGRHLAKVTEFQSERTASSRRSRGLCEEGDVSRVTWANLELGPLGNRKGGERRERIRRVRSREAESLQAVGGQGQPALLYQAAEAT